MNERRPMSQSVCLGILLALSGGMLDAYTYLCRGKVFATAETGNLVLLGLNLAQGNFRQAAYYLLPVLSFAGGVLAAELLVGLDDRRGLHWRQWVLLLECGVLVAVAFIPNSLNPAANMLVSFLSAVQMQSFRKFNGLVCSTTMCTGNLRSGTELLFRHLRSGKSAGEWVYYVLIGTFILGAVLSGWLSRMLGNHTVLLACIPLLAGFFLMFIKSAKKVPADL